MKCFLCKFKHRWIYWSVYECPYRFCSRCGKWQILIGDSWSNCYQPKGKWKLESEVQDAEKI